MVKPTLGQILALGGALGTIVAPSVLAQNMPGVVSSTISPNDYSKILNVFNFEGKTYIIGKDGKVTSEDGKEIFLQDINNSWSGSKAEKMPWAFKEEMRKAWVVGEAKRKNNEELIDIFKFPDISNGKLNVHTGWFPYGDFTFGPYIFDFGPKGPYQDVDGNHLYGNGDVLLSTFGPVVKARANATAQRLANTEQGAILAENYRRKIKGEQIPPIEPKVAGPDPKKPLEEKVVTGAPAGAQAQAALSDDYVKVEKDLASLTTQFNELDSRLGGLDKKVSGLDYSKQVEDVGKQIDKLNEQYNSLTSGSVSTAQTPVIQNVENPYDDSRLAKRISDLEEASKSTALSYNTAYTEIKDSIKKIQTDLKDLERKAAEGVEPAPVKTSKEPTPKVSTAEEQYLGGSGKLAQGEPQPSEPSTPSDMPKFMADDVKAWLRMGELSALPSQYVTETNAIPQTEGLEDAVTETTAKTRSNVGMTFLGNVHTDFSKNLSAGAEVRIGLKDLEIGPYINFGFSPDTSDEYTTETSEITGRFGKGIRTIQDFLSVGTGLSAKLGPLVIKGGVNQVNYQVKKDVTIMHGDTKVGGNTYSDPVKKLYGEASAGVEFGNLGEGIKVGIYAGANRIDQTGINGWYLGTSLAARLNFPASKE